MRFLVVYITEISGIPILACFLPLRSPLHLSFLNCASSRASTLNLCIKTKPVLLIILS